MRNESNVRSSLTLAAYMAAGAAASVMLYSVFHRTRPRITSSVWGGELGELPSNGSALCPAEQERQWLTSELDRIDEASFESFPASDPPSYW